jgi:hypothetical protein
MTSILETKKTIQHIVMRDKRISGLGISPDKQKIIIYTQSDKNGCPFINIPNRMAGFPIQIVCLNPLLPNFSEPLPESNTQSKLRYRPICGGISAAHRDVSAGTLGAIVEDAKTGEPLLLSNNHVFANCSTEDRPNAQVGDPIYQPGRADGAVEEKDVVATLARWIPYSVTSDNLVDAAVATPKPGVITSDLVLGQDGEFITPGEMAPIKTKTHVKKYGRTSGMTNGDIIDWDFATTMTYPGGAKVRYVDQLLAKLDTYSGDSGSILLDDNDNVVGMVFGGTEVNGERYAVANKIRNVAALANLKFI